MSKIYSEMCTWKESKTFRYKYQGLIQGLVETKQIKVVGTKFEGHGFTLLVGIDFDFKLKALGFG